MAIKIIYYRIRVISLLLAQLYFFSNCKKLVQVDVPDNKIASGNVYEADATAIAVLTSQYSKLSGTSLTGTATIPNISLWAALSADELTLWSGATNSSQLAYYRNSLSSGVAGYDFWVNAYPLIYPCNSAIEGLNASTSLTPAVKQQLLGEAKFLRAYFYFYLVNLYGDVPLALSTDYTKNETLARTDKSLVYQQIIADLKDARNSLVDGYVKSDCITLYPVGTAERVRPNKAAASALLARAYLYMGDYVNAEAQADSIINNGAYYSLATLNNAFLKNSTEAIWQLQPVTLGTINNTADAYTFVLSSVPAGVSATHPVYLSTSLLNSFETGDQRKTNGNWVNVYTDATGTYYYPYKYKNVTMGTNVTPAEYTMLLRLGEQYLIRAEARAQQGNITGSVADLDSIRHRAGLSYTTAATQPALLNAILKERRVELFTEMGQRWLDLKRTGSIDSVMTIATPIKGGSAWSSYQQLYPLPGSDITKDLNLIQNTGY